MAKRGEFDTSSDLKRLFAQELDSWCSRNRLSIEDLSARCGVSRSYLAHIGRYGRIPSKPVLILLALNFEMKDPLALLRAAHVEEPWPFESAAGIQPVKVSTDDFLSIKLDMEGFVSAIKSVVREQFKPRTLSDLLAGRPLRIGLNLTQPWFFESNSDGSIDQTRGLVPDLCSYLETFLRCPIQTSLVPFSRHVEKLLRGEIDIFGPMIALPNAASHILFSLPVNRIGISAVMRLRDTVGLTHLPAPGVFEDLRNPEYRIAVIKGSRAHLISNTRLNRPDAALIICETVEEGLDRILMKGVARPAHIFVCNSINAYHLSQQHPKHLHQLFHERSSMVDICDNSFAIRPDWPEALPSINQALSFIMNSGGFAKRSQDVVQRYAPGIFAVTTDPLRDAAVANSS